MIKVNIITKNLDTNTRVNKALEAGFYMETIVNSPKFKEMMLTMPDKWRTGETSKFKTMSNEQIYKTIYNGKEEWNDDIDNEIDMIVNDYYTRRGVVGYMNPGRPETWVNTRFFDSNPMDKVVSNFMHEYFHHLGMRHGGRQFRSSIPYYANLVVEELFYELTDLPKPEYKRVCSRSWRSLWLRRTCRWVRV